MNSYMKSHFLSYSSHIAFIGISLSWVLVFAAMIAYSEVNVMEDNIWIKCAELASVSIIFILSIYWFIHDIKSHNRRNQND